MEISKAETTSQKKQLVKVAVSFCSVVFILLFVLFCALTGVWTYLYVNNNFNFNPGKFLEKKQNQERSPQVKDVISDQLYEDKSDIVDVVSKASPAVVTVLVKSPRISIFDFDTSQGRTIGSGTGFFISSDGTLITNEHVVCGADAEDLLIVTSDQKEYTVSAVSVDSAQDIAVLRVNVGNDKVAFLKFANPDSPLRPGQRVIAIGNPFGDNPGSVTTGIISGINRNITAYGSCGATNDTKDYEGVIQTDAAINSGNSGGPLLNMRGEVIGVNSATLKGANNISYTVPYTTVLKVLDRYYKNNNRIISPFIGVSHQMIDLSESKAIGLPVGALVVSVQSGSPAYKAGIKRGDIITKVGDKTIKFSLVATLNQNFEPGQKTTITVFRPNIKDKTKGETLTLDITIGERP